MQNHELKLCTNVCIMARTLDLQVYIDEIETGSQGSREKQIHSG